jgi:hypothetical protein
VPRDPGYLALKIWERVRRGRPERDVKGERISFLSA